MRLCSSAKSGLLCLILVFEQPLFLAIVVRKCQNYWWCVFFVCLFFYFLFFYIGDVYKMIFSFLHKSVSTNKNNSYTELFNLSIIFLGVIEEVENVIIQDFQEIRPRPTHGNHFLQMPCFSQKIIPVPRITFGRNGFFFYVWGKQKQRPMKITTPIQWYLGFLT